MLFRSEPSVCPATRESSPSLTSPSPRPAPNRPQRRDIEGLRAIAVGTVLLYHLHVPWFPGGYAGVDVFFVISGFLITGLILREVARTGTISLKEFYARRARRLLPAASVVILFTLIAGWWVMPTSERTNLLSDTLGATLYVVNWVLSARSVDYLAEDAGVSPLQHYWSLSVEEQFYIVWPLLILLAVILAARSRLRVRPLIFVILASLGLASFIWSLLQTSSDPATAYFVTTTRLWELAAGALLAFGGSQLARMPRWLAEIGVTVGLAMILYTVVVFDASTPWPGSAAMVPVLGTVLVIAAGTAGHATLGGRLLGLSPMVWIGGLSYAIYLWHWPVIVLSEAQWGALSIPALVGLGALSILLAWATKHLVEDPIRFRPSLQGRPARSLVAGGLTMAAICTLTLAAWSTRPELSDEITMPGPAALVADPAAQPWAPTSTPEEHFTESGELEPLPELATEDVPHYYDAGCQVREGDPNPRTDCVYGDLESETEIVLWGDSKIGQYFSPFEAIAEQEQWRMTAHLKNACAPTIDVGGEPECPLHGQAVLDALLDREVPPHLVILSSGSGPKQRLTDGMSSTIESLQAADIPVVIVMDNPHPGLQAYECAADHAENLRECDFEFNAAAGEVLREVATRTQTPVINLNDWTCPGQDHCPVAIGGQLIYRQGSHLTDTYARSLTPFIYRELSALGLTQAPPEDIHLDEVPSRVTQ